MIVKVLGGYVEQIFDGNTLKSQTFISDGSVRYESKDGGAIAPPNPEPSAATVMVNPLKYQRTVNLGDSGKLAYNLMAYSVPFSTRYSDNNVIFESNYHELTVVKF